LQNRSQAAECLRFLINAWLYVAKFSSASRLAYMIPSSEPCDAAATIDAVLINLHPFVPQPFGAIL
jgi:hypothetical protein